MERYAHISEDARTQTIEEHLRGAAKLAEDFAGRIGFAEWGRLLALLHDLAKYTSLWAADVTAKMTRRVQRDAAKSRREARSTTQPRARSSSREAHAEPQAYGSRGLRKYSR